MMSRADEIRAQAQRVGSQPSTRSDAGARARKGREAKGVARTKRAGKTLNLDPQLNGDMVLWQADAATALGLTRVTFQTTVDALLRELLSDPELSERIINRIANEDA